MPRAPDFAFDQPYPFTAVSDQPDAACTECSDELKYPASELVAIKIHKARRPEGHWLMYCREHFAEWTPTDSAAAAEAERAEIAAKRAAKSKAKATKTAAATAAPGVTAAGGVGTGAPAGGAAAEGASRAAPARRSAPKPKPQPVPERAPVMCPNDFVEVSMTGVCPMCGEQVAG